MEVANDRATHALRNARCILTRAGFEMRIWRKARIDGMKSGVFIGWIRFGLVGEECRATHSTEAPRARSNGLGYNPVNVYIFADNRRKSLNGAVALKPFAYSNPPLRFAT